MKRNKSLRTLVPVLITAILLSLCFTGCSANSDEDSDANRKNLTAEEVAEKYIRSIESEDTDALLDLYADKEILWLIQDPNFFGETSLSKLDEYSNLDETSDKYELVSVIDDYYFDYSGRKIENINCQYSEYFDSESVYELNEYCSSIEITGACFFEYEVFFDNFDGVGLDIYMINTSDGWFILFADCY